VTRFHLGLVGLASLTLVGIAFLTLPAEELTTLATAVQAVGLVVALSLAVLTLTRDRSDRKVDRTLSIHQEFVSGDVGDARDRLHKHLSRGEGNKFKRAGRLQLRDDPSLNIYDSLSTETPFSDCGLLLRFFERAEITLRAGLVDDELFLELLGRHATWWGEALSLDRHARPKLAVHCLADWAETRAHPSRDYYVKWRNSLARDFD
jgi:hypothetical protein